FSPAEITEAISNKAMATAQSVITKLDMVGLLAVEMFVTGEGDILVNEIAPRPHNSGHHTIEGNFTSQFEQHLRSVMNMPLGDTGIRSAAAMVNLLGEDGYTGEAVVEGLDEALAEKGIYIHLYGKKITKPFRKMGHLTILEEDMDELKKKAKKFKDRIKIKA